MEDLERFEADRRPQLRETGWRPGSYVTLADLRKHGVQPKAVAARAQAIFREARHRPQRHAVLAETALVRLQVGRVTMRDDVAMFDDEEKGLAWLAGLPPAERPRQTFQSATSTSR